MIRDGFGAPTCGSYSDCFEELYAEAGRPA